MYRLGVGGAGDPGCCLVQCLCRCMACRVSSITPAQALLVLLCSVSGWHACLMSSST